MIDEHRSAMPRRQLALGTVSFAICFAVWGLISAFAPRFREIYHLSTSQGALLVAVPVLLGSLARLPMGLLTDRFRGRLVFTVLMLFAAVPAFAVPLTNSYASLLVVAFFLGMAGSSFAVGVGFVSPWFECRTARLGAGSVWTRQHRTVGGGFPRAVTRCEHRMAECVSRVCDSARGLGRSFRVERTKCRSRGPTQIVRCDAGGADARAARVGAFGILLSQLRWFCRVFDLSAKPVT